MIKNKTEYLINFAYALNWSFLWIFGRSLFHSDRPKQSLNIVPF
ncbi:MAG: hypothetical protein O4861_09510 [Trichodesmium sp. St16_bin4-tuft]|nr:hypothetical protein [Trichodesmium sp. St5_bin8]MDE5098557.1 hypothetical protein [Trichodesmium sp. St16_bin4-tuft]